MIQPGYENHSGQICGNCANNHYGNCAITLPANLAKALGFPDQYAIPMTETHPEWNCDLWEKSDE